MQNVQCTFLRLKETKVPYTVLAVAKTPGLARCDTAGGFDEIISLHVPNNKEIKG